jgi:hypothetical protein
MVGRNYDQAAVQLRASLTSEQMKFLASLESSLTVGRYFLCHAGIRPGVPFERQKEEDLLWIRDEFLNSRMDFGKIVVHGHTPTEEPAWDFTFPTSHPSTVSRITRPPDKR